VVREGPNGAGRGLGGGDPFLGGTGCKRGEAPAAFVLLNSKAGRFPRKQVAKRVRLFSVFVQLCLTRIYGKSPRK